jgi:CRISPR-associated exonuclease Cas4
MESYILISTLNDFIFCPRSIYYHGLYRSFSREIYQQKPQIDGEAAHKTIDEGTYSTRVEIYQGLELYSEKYNLCGKLDLFDSKTGRLTERKKQIIKVYDGYIYQVYAQYFCLLEMGFTVKEIVIHDLIHNKNYPVLLPNDDLIMFKKFETLVQSIKDFDLYKSDFKANIEKCKKCIYNNLCDYSLC